MLQAFLDAHGVPGPPQPGVFCVVGDQYGGVGIGGVSNDGLHRALYCTDGQFNSGGWATPPFTRHALLFDPLALIKRAEDAERERDYLRGELAEQERRAEVMGKLLDEYAGAERAALTPEQRRERAAQLIVDVRLRLIERANAAGIPAPTLDATLESHAQRLADQEELKTLRTLLHLSRA